MFAVACGSAAPAVSVGDASLSREEADEFVREQLQTPEGAEQVDDDAPIDAATYADGLTTYVLEQLVNQELEDRGITVTAEDLDNARAVSASPQAPPPTDAEVDRLARVLRLAYSLADQDPPTEESVRAAYEEAPVVQACSAHILLETQEAADDVVAELEGGADFATLAMERSTGPSGPNGGDLGCGDPGGFVEPFATTVREAEVGEVTGPVETEFGFHVILVSERTAVPYEDIASQALGQAINEDIGTVLGPAYTSWLSEDETAITIDPRFGTWNREEARVVPPDGADPAGTDADPDAGADGGLDGGVGVDATPPTAG